MLIPSSLGAILIGDAGDEGHSGVLGLGRLCYCVG